MASPGAGKTSFILKMLEALNGRLKFGVIEGDLATSIDAEKAMAAGAFSGPDQHRRRMSPGCGHAGRPVACASASGSQPGGC